jgi:hypothetical protein
LFFVTKNNEGQEVYEKGFRIDNIFPKNVNGKMIEDNIATTLSVGDKIYVTCEQR